MRSRRGSKWSLVAHADVFPRHGIFHDLVHAELMHPLSRRINHVGAGAIEDIEGGCLFSPRLQQVGAFEDGDDGPHRQIDIDQGGTIEGIVGHRIVVVAILADGDNLP